MALLKIETTVLHLGWVLGGAWHPSVTLPRASCLTLSKSLTLPPLQLLDLKMEPVAFCT